MTISCKTSAKAALALTATLIAGSALAAPGIATGNVNVRTGPGTAYSQVDQLYYGEHVEIRECTGNWCFVEHSGSDGWVSKNYLAFGTGGGSAPEGEAGGNPFGDCGFQIGPGGVQVGCGAGAPSGPPVPPPAPTPTPTPPTPKPPFPKLKLKLACFYSGPNYTGNKFCVGTNKTVPKLTGYWNDKISSIKLTGGAKAMICRDWFMAGGCSAVTSSRPNLPILGNKISSYKTF